MRVLSMLWVLAPAAGWLLFSPGSVAAAAAPVPGEGVYVFDVPLGPLALTGNFPVTVTTALGDQTGAMTLTTAGDGSVNGTMNIASTDFTVGGKVVYKPTGGSVTLTAKHGKDKLTFVGSVLLGSIDGKVTGKGTVIAGKNTFSLDISNAVAQTAHVEAHVAAGKKIAYSGTGVATVGGVDVVVKVTGSHGSSAKLSLKGKGFKFSGKGTAAAGLVLSWTAKGFGASTSGVNLSLTPIPAPSSLDYLASTIQYEEGVTITPNTVTSSLPPFTKFTVLPSLPNGLSIDGDSGAISGVPLSPAAQLGYTVTAANPAGSTGKTLLIDVRLARAKSFALETRTLDDQDKRHLLARTYMGVRQQDLDHLNTIGLTQFIDDMLVFPTNTAAETSAFAELVNASDPIVSPATGKDLRGKFPTQTQIAKWWERLMMETNAPFQETLAFFWHDHFGVTSQVLDGGNTYYEVDHINLLRTLANGNLRNMLLAVSRDPAMLVFLSGVQNTGSAPNENFGREFWELFTLGVGNGYTQNDIVQASKAWSGYRERTDADNLRYTEFDPTRHNAGAKSFLGVNLPGQNAGDDYAAVVDLTIASAPVAEHLSKKIFEFFCYKNPPAQLVADMAAFMRANNYEMTPFIKRLFQSEAFFSKVSRRSHTKNPIEFTIGFMRSTGLFVTPTTLDNNLLSLQQQPGLPPSVNGWPLDEQWVYGSGMLDRINFINVAIEDTTRQAGVGINIGNILSAAAKSNTPEAPGLVVDELTTLLRIELNTAERQAMIDYLNSQFTGGVVVASPFNGASQQHLDERVRGVLFVMAQHPSYHQR